MLKTYESRSSARRALNNIGHAALHNFDKLVKETKDGKFKVDVDKAEQVQNNADQLKADKTADKLLVEDSIQNPVTVVKAKVEAKAASKAKATKGSHALLKKDPSAPKVNIPLKAIPLTRESSIANPCFTVWDTAEKMPGARRKDVIAKCVEMGVAFYTARTQYQAWLTSKKADAARG